MCGSPKWTAPEVLNGEAYGEAADAWSYGVVLWEIQVRDTPARPILCVASEGTDEAVAAVRARSLTPRDGSVALKGNHRWASIKR